MTEEYTLAEATAIWIADLKRSAANTVKEKEAKRKAEEYLNRKETTEQRIERNRTTIT